MGALSLVAARLTACAANLFSPTDLSTSMVPLSCALPALVKQKNIIYAVTCTSCEKAYIGRTVQPLHNRLSGHRGNFYKLLSEESVDDDNDDFSLGLHLIHEHKCVDRRDFNKYFRVQAISNCSPALLEKQEHIFIHKLKTLFPVGLNRNNPFGLACIS